jgi:hypothetical protein
VESGSRYSTWPFSIGDGHAPHWSSQDGGRRLDGGVDDGRQLLQRPGRQPIFQGGGQLGGQQLALLVQQPPVLLEMALIHHDDQKTRDDQARELRRSS